MKEIAVSWMLVLCSALCDTYAAYVVKHKFNRQGPIDIRSLDACWRYLIEFVHSPLLVTALITFLAAPALWFIALNRLDLSVAYPVLVAVHLLLVMIAGSMLLGETVDRNSVIGSLLVLASLYFFYGSQQPRGGELHDADITRTDAR